MTTYVRESNSYRPLSEVFAFCHEQPQAVFLDSSLTNSLGRYSIVALKPSVTYSQIKGVAYRNEEALAETFEDALRQHLLIHKEKNTTSLPLTSGAIGYFTYDYGISLQGITSKHPHQSDIPEALFVFYKIYLVEDHQHNTLYLCAQGESPEAEKEVAHIEQWIENLPSSTEIPPKKSHHVALFDSDFREEDYKNAIDRLIRSIAEGKLTMANFTQHLKVSSKKKPYEAFLYLRTHNPSPFGAYLNYGTFQVLSASPERFLHMKQRLLETRPIKGTRKRGSNQEEDAKLFSELQNSPKDQQELSLVSELLCHELHPLCENGSVHVAEAAHVETYATVFQLVSTVAGKLLPHYDAIDLIRSVFPSASIAGAPKKNAIKIIDDLEHSSRGLYTGSIGYIGLDGSCDFNAVIRTAVYEKGVYHLGVGGGITAESEKNFEYEETLQKAKALLEALGGEDEPEGQQCPGRKKQ